MSATRYGNVVARDLSLTPDATRLLSQPRSQNPYHNHFAAAHHRVLFFAFDGTLVPIQNDASSVTLSDSRKTILGHLGQLQHNEVWVVSGRDKEFLAKEFENHPAVGLVSEHGAGSRNPCRNHWDLNIPPQSLDSNSTWRASVRKIFLSLCDIVEKSKMEEKMSGLVWHYRENEAFGAAFASATITMLVGRRKAERWDVLIEDGNCIVEVRPCGATKGMAIKKLLESFQAREGQQPGFILAAGDDATDECEYNRPLWISLLISRYVRLSLERYV